MSYHSIRPVILTNSLLSAAHGVDQAVLDYFYYVRMPFEFQNKERIIQRCKTIKEELMMNRWRPSRVEQLLLAGYDVEDM